MSLTFDVWTSRFIRMTSTRRAPGTIRDAIFDAFRSQKGPMSVAEVHIHVTKALDDDVAASSVRSYLNINTPGTFARTGRGTYRLIRR